MRSGHIAKDCKVYKTKPMIAKNLDFLMKERKVSIQELSTKTGLSRMGIYNIVEGKSTPRDDTIDILAKFFEVDPEELLQGIKRYDFASFIEKLEERYDSEENGLSIEEYLIVEFNVNPEELLIKHKLPSEDIQKKIAEKFDYEVKELFFSTPTVSLSATPLDTSHISVTSKEALNDRDYYSIFRKLNACNKKIIYNLCQDLYQSQIGIKNQ